MDGLRHILSAADCGVIINNALVHGSALSYRQRSQALYDTLALVGPGHDMTHLLSLKRRSLRTDAVCESGATSVVTGGIVIGKERDGLWGMFSKPVGQKDWVSIDQVTAIGGRRRMRLVQLFVLRLDNAVRARVKAEAARAYCKAGPIAPMMMSRSPFRPKTCPKKQHYGQIRLPGMPRSMSHEGKILILTRGLERWDIQKPTRSSQRVQGASIQLEPAVRH